MTSDQQNFIPGPASWGLMEESGSWVIELDPPSDIQAMSLNNFTNRIIGTLFQASKGLCRCNEAYCDLISMSADGKISERKEGEIVELADGNVHRLTERMTSRPNDEQWVFETIFIACDTQVTVPSAAGCSDQSWFPKSSEYYFGYRLELDETDIMRAVKCSTSFETSLDVWVERTLDPKSWKWRSNHAYAACNQPLLAKALREWEALVSKPIVEWSSRYYGEQITRYGFKGQEQIQ